MASDLNLVLTDGRVLGYLSWYENATKQRMIVLKTAIRNVANAY